MELILVPPIAYFLWRFVIHIFRQLETRDALDDLRPAAWEVAAAERELPEVRDGWTGVGDPR